MYKYYSYEEVKKHNTLNDCWLIAGNKVYDVSNYVITHPGGITAILKNINNDNINNFKFHSKKTQDLIKRCCIGRIKKTEYKKVKLKLKHKRQYEQQYEQCNLL